MSPRGAWQPVNPPWIVAMKRSYKISLVTSLMLCTAILCHHLMKASSESEISVSIPHPAEADPAPVPVAVTQNTTIPAAAAHRRVRIRSIPNRPADPSSTAVAAPLRRILPSPPPPTTTVDAVIPQATPRQRGAAPGRSSPAATDFQPRVADVHRPAPAHSTTEEVRRPAQAALPPYVVRAGDTFSSIAVATYGAHDRWVDIQAANPRIIPKHLRPGQVITLPRSNRAPRPPISTPALSEYVVRPGDTLTKIAKRFYHSESAWSAIYRANRDRIGPDPNSLNAGVALRMVAARRCRPQRATVITLEAKVHDHGQAGPGSSRHLRR